MRYSGGPAKRPAEDPAGGGELRAADAAARVAAVGTRLPVRVNPGKPGKIAIDTAVLFG
jgi:hypothetical protein